MHLPKWYTFNDICMNYGFICSGEEDIISNTTDLGFVHVTMSTNTSADGVDIVSLDALNGKNIYI